MKPLRDFFETLRALERAHRDAPRIGHAALPSEEPLRLGQDPTLRFATESSAFLELHKAAPHVRVEFFGLFGPHGPLPLHMTELACERQQVLGDRAIGRFFDLFHHRLLSLLYRIWAEPRPHVQHERPDSDRFMAYVACLAGLGTGTSRAPHTRQERAKLYYAGLLAPHTRNAAGLKALLSDVFGVAVHVEQFVGEWLELPPDRRCELLSSAAANGCGQVALGRGAVLGRRIWQRSHRFQVVLGPLKLEQFRAFVPGGTHLAQLVSAVRSYTGDELSWDLRLRLARSEPSALRLCATNTLGHTTWLRARTQGADDLCFDPRRATRREIR